MFIKFHLLFNVFCIFLNKKYFTWFIGKNVNYEEINFITFN